MDQIAAGRAGRLALAWACGPLALALLLPAMGCVDILDGNGVRVDVARDVRGFDRVTALGGLDVEISEGDFSVTVSIDENLEPDVLTTVEGGTLTIEVDDANIREKLPGPHVIIAMPALRDAETAGKGSLTATDFEASAPVSLELTGSGTLSWSGRATELDAVLAGDGTLSIEGSAESTELSLRGSGSIDARALIAEDADIQVDGPGELTLTVNGRVDARAAGGARVDLYGRVVEGKLDIAPDALVTTH
jgi:hypothetical protein